MPIYSVTFKPHGMPKRMKSVKELVIEVESETRDSASLAAREVAKRDGFPWLAITSIKLVEQKAK